MTQPLSQPTDLRKRELVELQIPGNVDHVVLARFTAATVGARAGFDIDEIEDLRLAVDELCVSFGPVEENKNLRMEFLRVDDTVRITCRFETLAPGEDSPSASDSSRVDWGRTDELSRQLLNALVDDHGREALGPDPCAWVQKQRKVAST